MAEATGNVATHISRGHHHSVNGNHVPADPVLLLNGKTGAAGKIHQETSSSSSIRNGDKEKLPNQQEDQESHPVSESVPLSDVRKETIVTSLNLMEESDNTKSVISASRTTPPNASSAIKEEKSASLSTNDEQDSAPAAVASDEAASVSTSAGSKMTAKGSNTSRKAHSVQSVSTAAIRKHHHHYHHHQNYYPSPSSVSSRVPSLVIPEMPLRLLVHTDMVGAIIGKSGNTIKEITKESKARVDVLRRDGHSSSSSSSSSSSPDKVVNIFGATDHCVKACSKILQVMRQESRNTDRDPHDYPIKILAHNSLVGRVIGKSGTSIKRIMESTNTKIIVSHQIFDPAAYNLPERVITITTGTDDHEDIIPIVDAVHQIFSKLRSCYESDMSTPMTGPAAVSYMGFPAGSSPQGSSPSHRFPPPFMTHSGPSSRHSSLPGPDYTRSSMFPPSSSSHFMNSGPSAATAAGIPAYMTAYPFHPCSPAAPSLPPFLYPADHARETAIIYIPNTCVGGVIGSGGSTIREMMHASGATIKVTPLTKSQQQQQQQKDGKEKNKKTVSMDQETGASSSAQMEDEAAAGAGSQGQSVTERKVTVTGTPESQWKAQMMIFRKVLMDPSASSSLEPTLRVEISVPATQVGRIIGKNGQTVRELQRLTRASIKLPEPPGEGSPAPAADAEIPVSIVGDFFSSQNAQRQIRALVTRAQVSSLMSAAGGGGPSCDYWTGTGIQRIVLKDHNDHSRRATGFHSGDPGTRGGKGGSRSRKAAKQQEQLHEPDPGDKGDDDTSSSINPTDGPEDSDSRERNEADQ